jgi:sensor histidine kinase YesM
MKEEKKTIIRPIYIILFLTIIALLFGGQNYINNSLKRETCSLWGAMFQHVPTFAIWAVFVPFIQIILRRFPLINSKNFWFDLIVHIGFATALSALSLLIIGTGHWLYYGIGRETLLEYIKFFSLIWFSYQYIMYTAMIIFLLAINYYKKYREKETQAMELQKLLVETQLNSLKMQLHPHFLFNTLNTISMLVRMDKKENAIKIISRLGDMLRQVLLSRNDQTVSLEQEIQLIEKYLSIEAIRFEEMLSYKFDPDENTLGLQIPDMLLQPIVENSIKHGMKNLDKPMHIEIKSFIKNDKLKIVVTDNGKGFDISDESFINKGIGLKNTIERCEKMFGKNQIEINSEPEKGTTIIFTVPIINKE